MSERQKFGVASLEGSRSPLGVRIPVYSDTGFGTLPRDHIFGKYLGIPYKPLWHEYFNDFDHGGEFNNITDTLTWGITNTGTGTIATADGDGGFLLLTNAAADNDLLFVQKVGESFKYAAGSVMGFGARFKVSDATQSDFVIGLVITDTTLLDVTDGIFFQKDDGDALLDFHVEKNDTATDATAIATVVADTFLTVQWLYSPEDAKIFYGVDGVVLGSLALTNVCDDEELTITFGLQNGEGVAKTMTVDWIGAFKYMGRP